MVERRCGKVLDIGELIANSTPRKLAAKLFGGCNAGQTLLPLNQGGGAKNIFCISGHVWNPMSLKEIASHLNGYASAWSVGLSGLDNESQPLRSARTTALLALAQIRAHQPIGPYHLLGYSYGGLIAFEICQQLVAAGEKIDSLILIDAFLAERSEKYKSSRQRAVIHARHLLRGGPAMFIKRLRERSERLKAQRRANPNVDKAQQIISRAKMQCEEAFYAYRPEQYAGDALLLRGSEKQQWMDFLHSAELGGWPKVIKGCLEIQNIPADHFSILHEPHATEVAQHVRRYLSRNEAAAALTAAPAAGVA